ncbi:hypothetical protein CBR_g24021 [Chara braunii]|uniref:Uncharacterized protein n=1 Tax=Chara braunii TaxID=69332 RepID=A0A388L5J3_CHABU|nr:hypothetical protein CBR_g24021 [Chara braunii]|eukprot:GBG77574.1 hypothetical protein CBR_g24021 [Chara braunii]
MPAILTTALLTSSIALSSQQQQHQQEEQHNQQPEQSNPSQQSGLSPREQDDAHLISRQAEEDPSHGVATMDTAEAPSTTAAAVFSEGMETTARLTDAPQACQVGSLDQHSGRVAAATSSGGSSTHVLDGSRKAAHPEASQEKQRNNAQRSGELQSVSVKDECSHADASSSARNHLEEGGHTPSKEDSHAEAGLGGRESAKPTPPALGLGISGLSPLPARPRRRSGSHSARAARLGSEAGACRENREGGADGGAHSTDANDVKVAAREMLLQLAGGETIEDAPGEDNLASCNGPELMDNDGRGQGRHQTDCEGRAGRTGEQPGPPGDPLGGLLGAIAGSGSGSGLGAALGGLMSSITAGDRGREGSTATLDDAGGFRDIVGQLMQSPVVDDMMMQILTGAGRGADAGSARSRRGPAVENPTGDLANMMSQMMPMVTQMLGGIAGGPSVPDAGERGAGNVDRSRTWSQAGRSVEPGVDSSRESNGLAGNQEGDAEEWKASLSKEEAAEWADTIRRDQTEQECMILQRPLSEAYIRGSPAKRQRRGVAVEGCWKKGEMGSLGRDMQGSPGQVNNSHGSADPENSNSSELPDREPQQRPEANRPLEDRRHCQGGEDQGRKWSDRSS